MRGRALVCVMALCAAASVRAALTDEPLEPEKAFALSATVVRAGRAAPSAIDLRFRIEKGYYLYRDRFKVDAPGLEVAAPRVPKGVEKDDPFVGRSHILKGSATLRVPLRGAPRSGQYELRVTAQGCAEDRICYAPFTQSVRVTLP
jgi:thioredoxin:protein disulfide reductase